MLRHLDFTSSEFFYVFLTTSVLSELLFFLQLHCSYQNRGSVHLVFQGQLGLLGVKAKGGPAGKVFQAEETGCTWT